MEQLFIVSKEMSITYSDLLEMDTKERIWLVKRIGQFYKEQKEQLDRELELMKAK